MHIDARPIEHHLSVDRLAWVLGALGLVLLPHVTRLPVWITALFIGMAVWRLGAARMRWGMAPAWLRLIMALAGIAAVGVQFRAWGGQEAGIAMLVVMMALKLTEAVRKRDALVLICTGYILVIGNFLYSQTLPTLAWMLVATTIMTATLLHLAHPTTGIPVRPRFRIAGALLVQALPIALILFLLFPRVPGPLWGLPAGQGASSGLSDSMEPGSIAQLSLSEEVAFRVSFQGEAPPSRQLYWRGPVLRQFDGRSWTQGDTVPMNGFRFDAAGDAVRYDVTLEPHRHDWLFALEMPAELPDGARATRTFQLVADGPIRERRRYSLTSYPEFRTGPEASALEIAQASRLPVGGNPRARAYAQRLAAQYADPRDIADAALLRFNQEEFFYTLNPPPMPGQDSIDEFLFQHRRGFCEHYAGAYTFIMRAAGVPARVVLGYQGGELNPLGDYLIVRQSDAHAWVEIHLDDIGWVRVDPTAAVAPDRIELGLSGVDDLEGRPLQALREIAWVNRLRLRWDDLNNRWNLFVLGFDREAQQEMLERFGLNNAGYGTLVTLMVIALSVVMGGLGAWLLWRMRPVAERDPAVRLYRRLERQLVKRGLPGRLAHEGPHDYAMRIVATDPALAGPVHEFVEAYVRYRYHRDGSITDLQCMQRLLRGNLAGRA